MHKTDKLLFTYGSATLQAEKPLSPIIQHHPRLKPTSFRSSTRSHNPSHPANLPSHFSSASSIGFFLFLPLSPPVDCHLIVFSINVFGTVTVSIDRDHLSSAPRRPHLCSDPFSPQSSDVAKMSTARLWVSFGFRSTSSCPHFTCSPFGVWRLEATIGTFIFRPPSSLVFGPPLWP